MGVRATLHPWCTHQRRTVSSPLVTHFWPRTGQSTSAIHSTSNSRLRHRLNATSQRVPGQQSRSASQKVDLQAPSRKLCRSGQLCPWVVHSPGGGGGGILTVEVRGITAVAALGSQAQAQHRHRGHHPPAHANLQQPPLSLPQLGGRTSNLTLKGLRHATTRPPPPLPQRARTGFWPFGVDNLHTSVDNPPSSFSGSPP